MKEKTSLKALVVAFLLFLTVLVCSIAKSLQSNRNEWTRIPKFIPCKVVESSLRSSETVINCNLQSVIVTNNAQ